MEFLETVCLFHRGHYGVFHCTAFHCFFHGRVILYSGLYNDFVHHCPEADFRRSCFGMAVFGLYHFSGKRSTAVLSGNRRAISGQNVYGSEKPPDLYYKRRGINGRENRKKAEKRKKALIRGGICLNLR